MEPMETEEYNSEVITNKSNSLTRKQCYRGLMNKVQEIQEREDLGLQTIKKLHTILKGVHKLDVEYDFFKDHVQDVDDTVLDSRILSSASNISVKCTEAAEKQNSMYDSVEFTQKITETLKDPDREHIQKQDWLKLLQLANKTVPDIPKYAFTFGAFDATKMPEPKQKKERKKREAPEKLEKKRLEHVVNLAKEEEGIDEIVGFLLKVLKEEYLNNNKRPISYYNYVIDSSSFSVTIENIFYCSFLIRNGTARIAIDGNGNPTIQPVSKKELSHFREEGGKNVQMITSMCKSDWEKLGVRQGFLQKHKHK